MMNRFQTLLSTSTCAPPQRRDEDWGFSLDDGGGGGNINSKGKENGGGGSGKYNTSNLAAAAADMKGKEPATLDFATFSHTVVCWKRWRGYTAGHLTPLTSHQSSTTAATTASVELMRK